MLDDLSLNIQQAQMALGSSNTIGVNVQLVNAENQLLEITTYLLL